MVVFSITVALHMRTSYWLKWFCALLFHCRCVLFTWKIHDGLKFHFCQIDQNEICTEVNFTSPELMWTQIMRLPYTEVKFFPELKIQTGLCSLPVLSKRDLRIWYTVFVKKFEQKEVFIYVWICTKLFVAKQDKKDRIMQRVWNLMFTFIGPVQFSLQKNVCYNSNMGK